MHNPFGRDSTEVPHPYSKASSWFISSKIKLPSNLPLLGKRKETAKQCRSQHPSLRGKCFDLQRSTVQYFVWDTASQSTKWHDMLEIWGRWPPWTPGYAYATKWYMHWGFTAIFTDYSFAVNYADCRENKKMRAADFIRSIKSLDTLQDNGRQIGISREKATRSLPTDTKDDGFHCIREEKKQFEEILTLLHFTIGFSAKFRQVYFSCENCWQLDESNEITEKTLYVR